MIGFVALAVNVGLEAILGAFIAGAVLNFVDRDTMSHPQFRVKLDAIGYGFVIPVFFVASGMKLDLEGLFSSPAAAGTHTSVPARAARCPRRARAHVPIVDRNRVAASPPACCSPRRCHSS